MLRKAPPLSSVEAFLAAASAPSFRAAAESLALSPSAFSRRIQMLERFVNAPLFDRSGPAVTLTINGRTYRDAIEPALSAIRDATDQMRHSDELEPVRVSASPSFAIDWLMPRLAGLQEQEGVSVDLVVTRGTPALHTGEADFAIVGGSGQPTDFPSERLVALDGVLAAAQKLTHGRTRPETMAELEGHELLAMKTHPEIWRRWLDAAGHPEIEPRPAAKFDSIHLMHESASNGLGLILATPLASERYLREGRLSRCLTERRPIGLNYRLVYRTPEAARRPIATRFRRWLDTEVAASCRLFETQTRT